MCTPETAGVNNEAHVLPESGQSLWACRVRTRPCHVDAPRARGESSRGILPGREGAPVSRGRAPSHPGDAPAPRRVPPWGSPQTSHPARAAKALPEAPGLEARVPGSGALGGMEPSVPCLAPGHVSGSSVVGLCPESSPPSAVTVSLSLSRLPDGPSCCPEALAQGLSPASLLKDRV